MKSTLIFFCAIICFGCDSFDHLTVYNSLTGEKVEILYVSEDYLSSDSQSLGSVDDKNFYQTTLGPGEVVKVGTVNRRYIPEADDINIDYIELRYAGDTVVFNGKKAIYTSFYNEKGKKWKYTVK